MLDFVQDGAAIAFVPKRRAGVREREEDSLFESSEIFSQVVYIVYNYASRCKCVLSGDRTEDLTWRGTVPRDQRSLSPRFHGVSRRPIHLFSGP